MSEGCLGRLRWEAMGGVGRDARGAFRLKLLDGRVLEEGKSSKKLPTLGDALSEGGMELPVGGLHAHRGDEVQEAVVPQGEVCL